MRIVIYTSLCPNFKEDDTTSCQCLEETTPLIRHYEPSTAKFSITFHSAVWQTGNLIPDM